MKTNPTTNMEKRLLMALLGVFGTLTTVLTALALALLVGFAWAVTSPLITEDAKVNYETAEEDDPYADMPW